MSEVIGTETERKRHRRLRPNEVAMLKQYLQFADPGIAIQFSDLPSIEMKRALFQSSPLRLVEKDLLKLTIDDDPNSNTFGMLKTVTIDEDVIKDYQWDLEAPEPKVYVRPRDSDEVRQRRPRNILMDAKFKIRKIADLNPRREGTHAWYNWEHCYSNDLSIPEYLSKMKYPRDIVVKSRSGEAWFNGPSTVYLYQDFKAGNIGIYDSTKQESDPDYWLKPEAIEKEDLETDDSNNESEESLSSNEPAPTPVG